MRPSQSDTGAGARFSVTSCFLGIFVAASFLFPGTVPSHAAPASGGNRAGTASMVSSLWRPISAMTTPRDYLAAAFMNGAFFAFGGYGPDGHVLRTVEAFRPGTSGWRLRAPMPTARAALAAVAGPGRKIYVFGGLNNRRQPLATVDVFDPRTNTWTRREPMPTARGDLAAALGANGLIYAIGGWRGKGKALNTVEAYNPSTNRWSEEAPLPYAEHDLAATTGPDGKIYALGGTSLQSGPNNGPQIYDPATNTWRSGPWVPMLPLSALAAVTGVGGRIYQIGGRKGNGPGIGSRVVSTVYSYRPGATVWTNSPPLPAGRYALAAVSAFDRIYAIGGMDAAGRPLRAVDVYDPSRDPWSTAAALPSAASEAGAAASNGEVYFLAGIVSSTGDAANLTTAVEAYSPRTNRWTERASLPSVRSGFATATGRDGRIYVIGGTAKDAALHTMDAYDPGTNTWTPRAPMPTARIGPAAVTGIGGKIYVLGGVNSGFKTAVEAYDPNTNTWSERKPLPTKHLMSAAVGPDGKIYVFGTRGKIYAYNPSTNAWSARATSGGFAPTATVTGAGGKIYGIAGQFGVSDSLVTYDPRANSWTVEQPPPIARESFALAADSNGKIYVLGGNYFLLEGVPYTQTLVHQVDVFNSGRGA